VAVDAAGNVALTGSFSGSATFGGSAVQSAGSSDIVVAKYNAAGTHLWSRGMGGSGADLGLSVALDPSGAVLVTGYFSGTVDFGGGPLTSVGGFDAFVAKYSASGAHLWSKRFGSTGNDMTNGVAVDAAGNVVVTGYFVRTSDFGGGAINSSAWDGDLFVAKYTPAGAHLWSRNFTCNSMDTGTDVAVDASGNVVLTGAFMGAINFGGGTLTSAGQEDGFVVKLDSAGAHVWSRRFGGSDFDRGHEVAVDSGGNVVVAGQFTGTVDFGAGPRRSTGFFDSVVMKLAAGNGSHLWSTNFASSWDDVADTVAVDGAGDVIVGGFFQETIDLGGGPLQSAGLSDVYVVKLGGVTGAHRWSRRYGGSENQFGYGAAATANGTVLLTGLFGGTADFGSGAVTSVGSGDVFLVSVAP
jgi:hypothetical protein